MAPRRSTTLKKRTTVMLPVDLLAELDRLRGDLGVSRSALLAMAAACFAAQMGPVLKPTHRAKNLAAVEEVFNKLLKNARKGPGE